MVTESTVANDDCSWDNFDPEWYVNHNYRVLRDDDRDILRQVRDYFARALGGKHDLRGLDLGTGANLYPSLALLPFCKEITMWERSRANVRWLESEVRDYASSWDAFWELLCEQDCYARVENPRERLAAVARVHQKNIFDLSGVTRSNGDLAPDERFDVGTMFFVAESITGLGDEFSRAVELFLRVLRPGAPFAAAFMRRSKGYTVNSEHFPAVPINEDHVEKRLRDLGCDVDISVITSTAPLREGYDGMILARGRRAG